MGRAIAVLVCTLALLPAAGRGEDSGPPATIGQLRSQATRLLARQVRALGVDPKSIVISNVQVKGDDAQLTWQTGTQARLMRLTHLNDRWWDTSEPSRALTAGYDLDFDFSANDAAGPVNLKQIYARPPTPAEFLPNHPLAPGWGSADAVCYFDITVGGSKAVRFKSGTSVDVWFPFVLDDQLQYSLSFFSDDKPSGIIKGTIFDNTVHFVLPEFILAPDKPLMAEIDGDPKPSH